MNKHNSYYLLEVVDMDTDDRRKNWQEGTECEKARVTVVQERRTGGPAAVWVGWGFLSGWNWKCKGPGVSLGGLRPVGLEENKGGREYLQERCRRWPEMFNFTLPLWFSHSFIHVLVTVLDTETTKMLQINVSPHIHLWDTSNISM